MVQTTVVFANGATQVINHTEQIFGEVKNRKKQVMTLAEKITGLVCDLGIVKSFQTIGGDKAKVLVADSFPVPKEHGWPKEINAIDGLDKRQLRRLHKNDKFTMFFNAVTNASRKQQAAA